MNNLPINEIKQKINIAEIIGQYVKLERSGQNFKGLCPFHDDHTPSMSVNTNKQIFKCFSCNTGGDVISFLTKYKNINLIDAIAELAPIANINFIKNNNTKILNPQVTKNLKINNLVMQYCFNNLRTPEFKNISAYLQKRNISVDSQNKFKLGYCGDHQQLIKFFEKKNIALLDLQEAGIIKITNNSTHSFLNNRIVFPIANENGNIVGFSARSLDSKANNKYVNSPETITFHKRKLLYNWSNALFTIQKKGFLIITEGYLDAISLDQIGNHNIVATMGTAISPEHLQIIRKNTKNVYLFMDNDTPGFEATIAIAKKLLNHKIEVKVIQAKHGKDPAEIIQNNPKFNMSETISKAVHPAEFILSYYQRHFNLRDVNNLKIMVNNVLDLINNEFNPVVRNHYIHQLSDISKVNIDDLNKLLQQSVPNPRNNENNVNRASNNNTKSSVVMQKNQKQALKSQDILMWGLINSSIIAKFASKHRIYWISSLYSTLAFIINDWYKKHPDEHQFNWKHKNLNLSNEHTELIACLSNKINIRAATKTLNEAKNCIQLLSKFALQLDLEEMKKYKKTLTNNQNILETSLMITKGKQKRKFRNERISK